MIGKALSLLQSAADVQVSKPIDWYGIGLCMRMLPVTCRFLVAASASHLLWGRQAGKWRADGEDAARSANTRCVAVAEGRLGGTHSGRD